ncbi:hypothetical protein OEB99_06075 [Actinotalea sp. M2MS4P-6]|uniref:hypothetical protein n=1 Tax=Actinotalea sp. M2MS4P-6 TaxID=2983762 RepID=UPI0021E3C300|nr:hypothetical protein [Actinotalea sp. M2MS4P-6]MCV2393869.1 hypothetical protein [Actinotalea sp. M2MS4P-6]
MRRPLFVPEDVRDALGLTGHALAFAHLVDDGWAAATRTGLHVLPVPGEDVIERAWTDVDGASLDEEGVLTVRWVDGTAPTTIVVEGRSRLARVVHERVQASVVLAEKVPVPGDRNLRVALRRSPDGALFTQVIGNGRVDLTDPRVTEAIDAAEGRIREAAGL